MDVTTKADARSKVRAVLFDFDGTLSTLRAGWEEVMAPMMKEFITGPARLAADQEAVLDKEIDEYIDQSTGIQTIFQMRWLADKVQEKGWNPVVRNEWEYKEEYNCRLLQKVNERIRHLEEGRLNPDDFIIKGAKSFLQLLHDQQIEMFLASGTDHPDVVHEAEVLGVKHYFKEIMGAPLGRVDCSKEKVMRDLLEVKGFQGNELAIIGDGKVEIRLARENGALSLGLASDEKRREGLNPDKVKRLQGAGAHWIQGDFKNIAEWGKQLGLKPKAGCDCNETSGTRS